MNINLYEYGLDTGLQDIEKMLRGALGNNVSKKNKDVRISEAIGMTHALYLMIKVENDQCDSEE